MTDETVSTAVASTTDTKKETPQEMLARLKAQQATTPKQAAAGVEPVAERKTIQTIRWSELCPVSGHYNWDLIDPKAAGIVVHAGVDTPAWARSTNMHKVENPKVSERYPDAYYRTPAADDQIYLRESLALSTALSNKFPGKEARVSLEVF